MVCTDRLTVRFRSSVGPGINRILRQPLALVCRRTTPPRPLPRPTLPEGPEGGYQNLIRNRARVIGVM